MIEKHLSMHFLSKLPKYAKKKKTINMNSIGSFLANLSIKRGLG